MSRTLAIALALAIILTSCAPVVQPVDVNAIEEKVKADLRVELEGLYLGQLDALKAENQTLRAEVDALKNQPATTRPDLSDLEQRIAALEAATGKAAPERRSFLAIQARTIAETLPGWNVISDECGMGLGIIDGEGNCITGFTGNDRDNGSSGWFLVLASVSVMADYGINVEDTTLFFVAKANFPEQIWDGAESAEDQELAQSILEWPSFEGEAGPGTHAYALRWWALSEKEAQIIREAGFVRELKR